MESHRILFINACTRPQSRTKALADHLLTHLHGTVEEVRLYDELIPPLDQDALSLRTELSAKGDFSHPMFRYARQFAQADTIVIAAPFWDLLFPAVLRNYIEAITVTGLCFRYSPEGIPQGLCKARQLFYVTTAGGPVGEFDFGFRYIQAMASGFYGIPEVTPFTAEGLDIYGADPAAILQTAFAGIDDHFISQPRSSES